MFLPVLRYNNILDLTPLLYFNITIFFLKEEKKYKKHKVYTLIFVLFKKVNL